MNHSEEKIISFFPFDNMLIIAIDFLLLSYPCIPDKIAFGLIILAKEFVC